MICLKISGPVYPELESLIGEFPQLSYGQMMIYPRDRKEADAIIRSSKSRGVTVFETTWEHEKEFKKGIRQGCEDIRVTRMKGEKQ